MRHNSFCQRTTTALVKWFYLLNDLLLGKVKREAGNRARREETDR
jgi:hypothetical protein